MRALALPLLTVALLTGCASHGFYQWQGSMLAGSPTNLEKRARNVRRYAVCVCPNGCGRDTAAFGLIPAFGTSGLTSSFPPPAQGRVRPW